MVGAHVSRLNTKSKTKKNRRMRDLKDVDKHKPCENQCRHFAPFVVSTDEMFGFEARAFHKRLAKLLAEEWEKPYPTVRV